MYARRMTRLLCLILTKNNVLSFQAPLLNGREFLFECKLFLFSCLGKNSIMDDVANGYVLNIGLVQILLHCQFFSVIISETYLHYRKKKLLGKKKSKIFCRLLFKNIFYIICFYKFEYFHKHSINRQLKKCCVANYRHKYMVERPKGKLKTCHKK